MTSVRGLLPLAIATCLGAASCSLVVQFHDQPASGDASTSDDALAPSSDSGTTPEDASAADAADASAADSAPPTKEAGAAPDHYAPCSGLVNGDYCANDGPTAYAGPSSDLLTCVDGGLEQALGCDGGCLHLPAPFPDACDPCVGVADGHYCGRDLAGFPVDNADFLIQCQAGNTVQDVACLHGCGSHGTLSACNP